MKCRLWSVAHIKWIMEARTLGAAFLDDNRVDGRTKTNYNSKINVMKGYLFTHYPEVIDTTFPCF